MLTISTHKAPAAIGPYSQAVRSGNFLFCSGQLGIDPDTKALVENDINKQTLQIFSNIKAVLNAADLALANIVKTTIFLSDMANFPIVNELYAQQFEGHKPARSTVQAARLPLDALIEIECIAVYEN